MRQRRRPGRAARLRPCLEVGAAPAEFALSPLLVANVGEEGEGNLLGMRYLCKQSGLARRIAAFVWQMAPTPITSPAGIGQPALRGRVQRPGRP